MARLRSQSLAQQSATDKPAKLSLHHKAHAHATSPPQPPQQ
jgi:hypothetical protein